MTIDPLRAEEPYTEDREGIEGLRARLRLRVSPFFIAVAAMLVGVLGVVGISESS